jgi:hypothetical protein
MKFFFAFITSMLLFSISVEADGVKLFDELFKSNYYKFLFTSKSEDIENAKLDGNKIDIQKIIASLPKHALESFCIIESGYGYSTGFLVRDNEKNYIYTAAHCVIPYIKSNFNIFDTKGNPIILKGTFELPHDGRDVVRVECENKATYIISKPPPAGTKVGVYGNGKNQGITAKYGQTVSFDNENVYINISTYPGDSGAPVVISQNEIIGVVSVGLHPDRVALEKIFNPEFVAIDECARLDNITWTSYSLTQWDRLNVLCSVEHAIYEEWVSILDGMHSGNSSERYSYIEFKNPEKRKGFHIKAFSTSCLLSSNILAYKKLFKVLLLLQPEKRYLQMLDANLIFFYMKMDYIRISNMLKYTSDSKDVWARDAFLNEKKKFYYDRLSYIQKYFPNSYYDLSILTNFFNTDYHEDYNPKLTEQGLPRQMFTPPNVLIDRRWLTSYDNKNLVFSLELDPHELFWVLYFDYFCKHDQHLSTNIRRSQLKLSQINLYNRPYKIWRHAESRHRRSQKLPPLKNLVTWNTHETKTFRATSTKNMQYWKDEWTEKLIDQLIDTPNRSPSVIVKSVPLQVKNKYILQEWYARKLFFHVQLELWRNLRVSNQFDGFYRIFQNLCNFQN